MGIIFPDIGTITFFPFKLKCLSSVGLIQIAVSPKIVSGRVVATTRNWVLGFGFWVFSSSRI